MKYYECKFTYTSASAQEPDEGQTEIINDVLAAELGEIGFESFTETANGLNGYIPESSYAPARLHEKLQAFPLTFAAIHFEAQLLEDRDWNEEWEKNYFQPISIGQECIIHASFHTVAPGYKYDIIIDPKMSFGTGNHETTYLMLSELLGLALEGKAVLDMGCGTGVLAILAFLKGAARVTAVDIDEWAYRNTIENVHLNHAGAIDAFLGDAGLLPSLGTFDIILANINRNILLNDLHHYAAALNEGGLLLMSGFYSEDIPLITGACGNNRLAVVSSSERNKWAAVICKA
ncbi:ribosomal protein L11 methyltransferase [Bacteroidia bacterium]|nr:ribosomal protein L11 methyltransferase [Bacteroidia bacterium]